MHEVESRYLGYVDKTHRRLHRSDKLRSPDCNIRARSFRHWFFRTAQATQREQRKRHDPFLHLCKHQPSLQSPLTRRRECKFDRRHRAAAQVYVATKNEPLPRKTTPIYIDYLGDWRQGRNHACVRSIRSIVVRLSANPVPAKAHFIPDLKPAYL